MMIFVTFPCSIEKTEWLYYRDAQGMVAPRHRERCGMHGASSEVAVQEWFRCESVPGDDPGEDTAGMFAA